MDPIPSPNTFEYYYLFDEIIALYPFNIYNQKQTDFLFNFINNELYENMILSNYNPGIKDPSFKNMFSIIEGTLTYPIIFLGNILPAISITIRF